MSNNGQSSDSDDSDDDGRSANDQPPSAVVTARRASRRSSKTDVQFVAAASIWFYVFSSSDTLQYIDIILPTMALYSNVLVILIKLF